MKIFYNFRKKNNRHIRYVLPGLAVLYLFSQIQTIGQSFPVQTYTLENGLNTNYIHDVAQDKQGQMWFATEYGVSVYDGYTWKNYSDKDGLPRYEYFPDKS